MAENDSTRTLINGFEPVTVADIEFMGGITYEQAEAMGALFRTIARLSDDREIQALCAHGSLQAAMQANDIDMVHERAVKAGLVTEAA